jgi:hypothetical protein
MKDEEKGVRMSHCGEIPTGLGRVRPPGIADFWAESRNNDAGPKRKPRETK